MQIKINKTLRKIFHKSITYSKGSSSSIGTIRGNPKNKGEILFKHQNSSKCLKEDYKPHQTMKKVLLNIASLFLTVWNQINKIYQKKNKSKN